MSDGFKAEPADIEKHAGEVDRLGDQLGKAGEKGAGVDLGIETYGIIGQAFSASARQEISETGHAITELSTAFSGMGDALRACAETYTGLEEELAAGFDEMLGGS